jgi:hypothetical protein
MNKKWGLVIPAGENRLENLAAVGQHVAAMSEQPDQIVIICDGWFTDWNFNDYFDVGITKIVRMEKYFPDGLHTQPRNVGVKNLSDDIDYVWFLDSDCIVAPQTLSEYKKAEALGTKRILIGPYEWLDEGRRKLDNSVHNDPRSQMFIDYKPDYISVRELNFALANFSGNLVWPVEEFKKVGGYWNEINMGRCEDGELGLRAAAIGVPMSVVPNARAWHLQHEVNAAWVQAANGRDVPMINARHPWVRERGLIVVDKDGKRFDFECPSCKLIVNTLEIWNHPCQKP